MEGVVLAPSDDPIFQAFRPNRRTGHIRVCGSKIFLLFGHLNELIYIVPAPRDGAACGRLTAIIYYFETTTGRRESVFRSKYIPFSILQ
jgi:hypothetical protein